MRLTFRSILCRVFAGATIILLCAGIYHFKSCPANHPVSTIQFPTISLMKSPGMANGLLVGDMVLIMNRNVGFVTETDINGHYYKVSYVDKSGHPKVGTFPYTILEKIQIHNK